MAVVKELIKQQADGKLCFGDYTLAQKAKLDGFSYGGDVFKVKTFEEITKLERNGLFAYESVPGTSVFDYTTTKDGVSFTVEGPKTAQVIVMLEDETDYEVYLDNKQVDLLRTNLGGKLALNIELEQEKPVEVTIKKHE